MRPGKFRSCVECCLAETSEPGIRKASVAQTSESGTRVALGAQTISWGSMLFDGLRLRPALFVLGLGLLFSFVATRIFQSMLSGTRALDPVVLSGVIAALLPLRFWLASLPAWPTHWPSGCRP
jgi:hypothetical protein